MSIFDKILARDFEQTRRLGNPLGKGSGPFLARMNFWAQMRGSDGFRQPPRGPKLSKGGRTRRESEAHLKEIYQRNLKAEGDFRASVEGKPGWGIRQINRAIERREHLKS